MYSNFKIKQYCVDRMGKYTLEPNVDHTYIIDFQLKSQENSMRKGKSSKTDAFTTQTIQMYNSEPQPLPSPIQTF